MQWISTPEWTDVEAAVQHGPVCVVQVQATQGSAPREAGAWMAVTPEAQLGTIGGGHLEWEALRLARAWMHAGMPAPAPVHRMALGPALGQCCGGAVQLALHAATPAQWPALQQRLQQRAPAVMPVALFGAGHVGQALVRVLAPLPMAVTWVDSRDDIFPDVLPPRVQAEHSAPVHAAVDGLPSGSCVLVMSFSHAEDLDIVAACLQRQRRQGDLPWVGLIGSATKWALFQRRLAQRGFAADEIAHITCPIGVPGISGKAPAVIAVAVAAQLLQQMGRRSAAATTLSAITAPPAPAACLSQAVPSLTR